MVNVAFVNRMFGNESWKKQLKLESPTLVNASGETIAIEGTLGITVSGDDGKPFDHDFLVVKRLPGLVYGLVGLDLQFKLGITLGNIPMGIVASVVETDEVTDLIDLKLNLAEAVRKLKLTNKNDLNYVNLLHTYRLRVKDNLKDLMDFNSGLQGFCSHPDATIKFRTSDEDPVNVRQYDLPFVHREIVDAQIKQWFDTGIIEKSTELDHSNNPVMVVPKRDLQGKVKGWRVCIDPRRINAKIKSSS